MIIILALVIVFVLFGGGGYYGYSRGGFGQNGLAWLGGALIVLIAVCFVFFRGGMM